MITMQSGLSLNMFTLTKMYLYVRANVICEWTLGDVKRVWVHISFQCVRVNPDILSWCALLMTYYQAVISILYSKVINKIQKTFKVQKNSYLSLKFIHNFSIKTSNHKQIFGGER
jgi:hypothetical protein